MILFVNIIEVLAPYVVKLTLQRDKLLTSLFAISWLVLGNTVLLELEVKNDCSLGE